MLAEKYEKHLQMCQCKYRVHGKKTLQNKISFWSRTTVGKRLKTLPRCQYIWSWGAIYMELGAYIYGVGLQYIWSQPRKGMKKRAEKALFRAKAAVSAACAIAHLGRTAMQAVERQRIAAAHAKLPVERAASVAARSAGSFEPLQMQILCRQRRMAPPCRVWRCLLDSHLSAVDHVYALGKSGECRSIVNMAAEAAHGAPVERHDRCGTAAGCLAADC